MSMVDHCERCGARVARQGDHTCPPCAAFLGRDTSAPFWGNFANHPDSRLRRDRAQEMMARADLAIAAVCTSIARG